MSIRFPGRANDSSSERFNDERIAQNESYLIPRGIDIEIHTPGCFFLFSSSTEGLSYVGARSSSDDQSPIVFAIDPDQGFISRICAYTDGPGGFNPLVIKEIGKRRELIDSRIIRKSCKGTIFRESGTALVVIQKEEGLLVVNNTTTTLTIAKRYNQPPIVKVGESFRDLPITDANVEIIERLLHYGRPGSLKYPMFTDGKGNPLQFGLYALTHAKNIGNNRKTGHILVYDEYTNSTQMVNFTPTNDGLIEVTCPQINPPLVLNLDGVHLSIGEDLSFRQNGEEVYLGRIVNGVIADLTFRNNPV